MAVSSEAMVVLEDVHFSFDAGRVPVLAGVSLRVQPGEVVALVGPSGAGKSTVLRLVAQLLQPDAGRVDCAGRVAMVFQDPRLLPWRTVAGNLDFALEAAGVPAADRAQRWQPLLAAVGLEHAAALRPRALSGGMAQRVGVVRALSLDPAVLLLDEPFGALDPLLREDLQRGLARLLADRRTAALLVTHDVQEAVTLADRVIVLGGSPAQVVQTVTLELPRPRDPDVVWTPAGTRAVQALRSVLLGREAGGPARGPV